MRHVWGLALVAALMILPAPALVDAQTPPAHREAGQRMGGAPDGKPFGLLMENRVQLGLTDQQMGRLQQIAQRLEQQNAPLLQQLRDAGIPVRPERRDGVRDMTPEQRRALRDRLEAHRPTLMQLRKNAHTAMQEARNVLTAEQQERLRVVMRQRDAEAQARGDYRGDPRGTRPHRDR
jgi:hypothetical protein